MATVLDRKTGCGSLNGEYAGFKADIASATDYYPFGMEMPGRTFSSESSRFGFNGKEKDNEVRGNGNSIDFGARIYDPRSGRWLSLDPLASKYPGMSPYNYTGNNPIAFIDPDGKRLVLANDINGFVLSELQKLTSDVLAINKKTGEVYIKKFADDKSQSKVHGTILIRDVIAHTRTTTVDFQKDRPGSGVTWPNSVDKNAYNSGGVDPTLVFSTNNGGAHYDVKGETKSLKQKSYIVLGGELIHALIAMDGHRDKDDIVSHIYKNIFGEDQVEKRNINEFKTHGIGRRRYTPSVYRRWYPTENDLRVDNREPLRVSYEDENQYKYRPDNKSKLEKYEKEKSK